MHLGTAPFLASRTAGRETSHGVPVDHATSSTARHGIFDSGGTCGAKEGTTLEGKTGDVRLVRVLV
jgi:hypothetical protein